MSKLEVVIMAAGHGSRLQSDVPKALHQIAGVTMLAHVLRALVPLGPAVVHVVVNPKNDSQIKEELANFSGLPVRRHVQEEINGTGGALLAALPGIEDDNVGVLVVNSDMPLIRAPSLARLAGVRDPTGSPEDEEVEDLEDSPDALRILTAKVADPSGMGRVLHDLDGQEVCAIVEERNAAPNQLLIDEIYVGACHARAGLLRSWSESLRLDPVSGEFYLTSLVDIARDAGFRVQAVKLEDASEAMGINNAGERCAAEQEMQRRLANALLADGVTLQDPQRLVVRGEVSAGRDCQIDVGVILEGVVRLGDNVRLGAYSVLRDCEIESGAVILPFCYLEQSRVESGALVGPYARLRGGSEICSNAVVGNFVEVKNSRVGAGSKVKHLAYLGDASLGEGGNLGAGVVVANYDGQRKHATTLGEGVFVGSNATLVAPLTLGDKATVAAGSTITKDVQEGALAVTRARLRELSGWHKRRSRKRPPP